MADVVAGIPTAPLHLVAEMGTAKDPRASVRNALGADMNLALFGATDGLGRAAHAALAPVGARVVAGLRRAGVWDAVAKAGYPEAAARVLRDRVGMSPEEAARAVHGVDASGEDVNWRGQEASAPGLGGRKGMRSVWTTDDGLEAPNVPWKYGSHFSDRDGNLIPLGDAAGVTDPRGNIIINSNLLKTVDGRLVADNNAVIRALRHEAVHRSLSPKLILTKLRARIGQSAYEKSQLVRYLEESFAEAHATGSLKKGFDYPLSERALKFYGLSPERIVQEAKAYGLIGGIGMGGAYLKGEADVNSSHGR